MKLLTTKKVNLVNLNRFFPTQVYLDFWRKIKVVIAPPGIKDIGYDPTNSIEFYNKMSFKDGWIGCPPLQTIALKNFKQDNRKPYGFCNYSFSSGWHFISYGNRNIINAKQLFIMGQRAIYGTS